MSGAADARLAAFLRGINLGKRRVKMKKLRRHFEEVGLENVGSHIASGNVVFDDPGTDRRDLQTEIEDHLEEALGFATAVFLRTIGDVEALAEHERVTRGEEEGFTPYVVFLDGEADDDVDEALGALETSGDRFHVLGREVLWLRRGGIGETSISTRDFERALGGPEYTRRKVTTLRKMVEKFGR